MKEIHKITHGYVTQIWDAATGVFLNQEFTAGDIVEYEDEIGDSIDETEPNYQPFNMVQPPVPNRLPVVEIRGKQFFVDSRLLELRNVDNPHLSYKLQLSDLHF